MTDQFLDQLDARFDKLESGLKRLQWMVGFALAGSVAILIKLFLIGYPS